MQAQVELALLPQAVGHRYDIPAMESVEVEFCLGKATDFELDLALLCAGVLHQTQALLQDEFRDGQIPRCCDLEVGFLAFYHLHR